MIKHIGKVVIIGTLGKMMKLSHGKNRLLVRVAANPLWILF